MELTILIPARNEETTIKVCVEKANMFLKKEKIDGEVLIADNNSTDETASIAKKMGARVVQVQKKGYGSTLIQGSKTAKGKYVLMGDADDSYNFLEAKRFIEELKLGNDLVIGNRLEGKMEKGSMKWIHRYIGTPILSWLVKKKYHIQVGDINCGMRGYVTEKINGLDCQAEGMEYATEMLIKAKKSNLAIKEIPINFYKDKRNKRSHLRSFRDGVRHLKTIIRYIIF